MKMMLFTSAHESRDGNRVQIKFILFFTRNKIECDIVKLSELEEESVCLSFQL